MRLTPAIRRTLRACAALALGAAAAVAFPALAQLDIADGTNPPNVLLCPGDPGAPLDAFTVAATPNDAVTRIYGYLTPAGAFQLVDHLEVQSGDGATVYASLYPVGDYLDIPLATAIPATASATPYRVVVFPKGHAAMPASGKSLPLQFTVRSANATNRYKNFNDVASATVTLDNEAPPDVAFKSVATNTLPAAAQVTLSWSTLPATMSVVVLRNVGAPVTEVPVEGATYALNQPVGTAGTTVVYAGTGTTLADTTGLVNGKPVYYRVFMRDPCGNYASGASVGPLIPGNAVKEGALAGTGPVVGLLNPGPGAVSSPFRVQVRAFSPKNGTTAQNLTGVVLELDSGSGFVAQPALVRNPNYGGGAESGIFEVGPLDAKGNSPGFVIATPGRYTLRAKATNASGTVYSAAVGIVVTAGKGDGNLLVRDNSAQLCSDCHALPTHSSEATGTKYGSWFASCRGCHTPHDTTNASLVAQTITPPAVNGVQPPSKVQLSAKTGFFAGDPSTSPGAASYANGPSVADPTARRTGVCQVCHTRTDYYRADGGEPKTHYTSGCVSCHSHGGGFKPGGCTGCHGTEGRTAFSSVAPPKDTCGNTTNNAGDLNNRVGAHQKHLTATASNPIACEECHVNPPVRADHPGALCDANARAAMAWGPLANGTVDAWSAGSAAPAWNPNDQSCATTYCHGAFPNSGVTSRVTWNSTVSCGSCHGTPPLTNHAAADTACVDCHGPGYSTAGITSTAVATHVNGKLEVAGTGCTMCHGDSARPALAGVETQDNRFQSAPPRAATGVTVPATQAHLSHVYNGTTRRPLLCDDCHSPTPTGSHKNGTVDFGWSPLANGAGTGVNYTGAPSYTCATSYCHGDNFSAAVKGAQSVPSWTVVDGSMKQCGSCHKSPPTDPVHTSLTSRGTTAATACNACHGMTVLATGAIDLAGGRHVDGQVSASYTCTSCHGNPPTNTTTAAPANANNPNGVGAHAAHTSQTTYRNGTVACSECHGALPQPGDLLSVHVNGTVAMTPSTGSLVLTSTQGNVGGQAQALTWNSTTCANTYCHGNFRNGKNTAAAWLATGGLTCNSCHGAGTGTNATLPGGTHPQGSTDCSMCHAGYTLTTVDKTKHLNGLIDYDTKTCSSCHGTTGRVSIANADAFQTAAPPQDVSKNTATTFRGVGAHESHVNRNAFRTNPLACSECHNGGVPVATNQFHTNGTITMVGGTLATTSTQGNLGTGQTLTWNGTTCANTYCHGNFRNGKAGTPGWTGTFTATSTMTCNSCHGAGTGTNATLPGGTHPQGSTDCSMCHAGYTQTAVDKTKHLNGLIDYDTKTCSSCHGTAGRVSIANADAFQTAAPPQDVSKNTVTTARGVGAHESHVNRNAFRTNPLACSECHSGGVPASTDMFHTNATITMVGGTLATTSTQGNLGSAQTLTWNGTTCANTYCHGNFRNGKAGNPGWTGTFTATTTLTCNSCHGAGTGANATLPGGTHPQGNSNCSVCHVGYTQTSVDKARHLNGLIEVDANSCTSCHGTSGRGGIANADPFQAAAPPQDMAKNLVTTARGVGAHVSHVNKNSFRNDPLACTECHTGGMPASATDYFHTNGTTTVAGGTLALTSTQGNAGAAQALTWNGTTCANTYCHGNFRSGGNAAPTWAATFTNVAPTNTSSLTCVSCHASPPADASHTGVSTGNKNCSQCHGAAYNCLPGSLASCQLDKAQHLNGQIQTVGMTCASCHGRSTNTVDATAKGVVNATNLLGSPPNDLSGSATSNIVGAHLAHLNPAGAGQIYLPLKCSDCHGTAADSYGVGHADGTRTITLANSTAGNYGSGATVAWTAGNPGSCVTYCHGDRLPSGASVTLANFQGAITTWTWDTTTRAACNSCHGLPPDPTGTHAGVAAAVTSCNGCHAETVDPSGNIIFTGTGATATTKHINGVVEGGESMGGQACNTCHGSIYTSMNSGALHRHQMANATAPTLTPSNTYATTATAQTCTQCHVDHNVFRPDVNATAGATRAKNLRTAIATQPTTAAGYTDTDHSGTTGLCVSCHATAQTKATGLPDAGVTTPVVNGTSYGSAAHNYALTPNSSFKDASSFKPNCSKCHDDNAAKKFQGSTGEQYSLHASSTASLQNALGITSPGAALEENACYRCHSTTSDVNPGGGPAKPVAGKDWFGANGASMSSGSEGVFAAMQKSGTTIPTATTDRLYFRNNGTTNAIAGSKPTGWLVTTSGTYLSTTWSATTNQRDMAPTSGTTTATTSVTSGTTSPRYLHMVQFVSPPVYGSSVTIPSGAAFTIATRQTDGADTCYERFQLFKRTSAGVNTALNTAVQENATVMSATIANRSYTFNTNTAVTLNAGDVLVLEVEARKNSTTSATVQEAYGNFATDAAMLTFPVGTQITFQTGAAASGSGHDASSFSALHKPVEALSDLSNVANKHVECADCHDPHEAQKVAANSVGTASAAGTTTTLVDGTKAWTASQWVGAQVMIRSGARAWLRGTVTANTATQLTFTPAMATATATGDVYELEFRNGSGTATAAGATTITDSGKAWQANQWAGYSISIVAGTGVGQTRPVASHTATAVTVATAFSPAPAVGSVYAITRSPEAMTGATGVNVAAWGANWAGATTFSPAAGSTTAMTAAVAGWQVCFKCHSAANTALASWDSTWTNLALEFNPQNASYHPVLAALPATDPGANGSSRLAASQLINGWQPGQVMTCTDCHNADAASPAAQGPHGSAIRYMLAGVNKAWPYTTAAGNGGTTGTLFRLATSETGIGTNDGLFCRNCHPSTSAAGVTNNFHTNGDLTGGEHGGNAITACVRCHIRVPHGGKVSRLILTSAAPARYQVTGQTPNFVRFTKTTPTGYGSISNYFGSSCSEHSGGASGGEAW